MASARWLETPVWCRFSDAFVTWIGCAGFGEIWVLKDKVSVWVVEALKVKNAGVMASRL